MSTIIRNKEQSKELWRKFNELHHLEARDSRSPYNQPTSSTTNSYPLIQRVTARKIQKFWKQFSHGNALIKIDPKTAYAKKRYSAADLFTFNNTSLHKSINIEKTEEFLAFLASPQHDAKILKDPNLPYVLTGLKTNKKISQRQYNTWTKYCAAAKDFEIEKICYIVDEKGNFTKEAEYYLLPIFNDKSDKKYLTKEKIESFRLLISTLPRAEQIFYLTSDQIFKIDPINRSKFKLGRVLDGNGIFFKSNGKFSHLSASANDAFGIAKYGFDEFFPQIHHHGNISKKQIEHGIEKNERTSALHHESITDPKKIHIYENPTAFETEEHDRYHSLVMSSIPNSMLELLNELVKSLRNTFNFTWSSEIWELRDAEFLKFYDNPIEKNLSKEEKTRLFFEMLIENQNADVILNNIVIATLLLDIIENSDLEKLINIKSIPTEIKKYLDKIINFYQNLKDDSKNIKLLKILIFSGLNTDFEYENFEDFFNENNVLINKYKNEIEAGLKFGKRTKKQASEMQPANTLYLACHDQIIDEKFLNNLKTYDQCKKLGLPVTFDNKFPAYAAAFNLLSKELPENINLTDNLIRHFVSYRSLTLSTLFTINYADEEALRYAAALEKIGIPYSDDKHLQENYHDAITNLNFTSEQASYYLAILNYCNQYNSNNTENKTHILKYINEIFHDIEKNNPLEINLIEIINKYPIYKDNNPKEILFPEYIKAINFLKESLPSEIQINDNLLNHYLCYKNLAKNSFLSKEWAIQYAIILDGAGIKFTNDNKLEKSYQEARDIYNLNAKDTAYYLAALKFYENSGKKAKDLALQFVQQQLAQLQETIKSLSDFKYLLQNQNIFNNIPATNEDDFLNSHVNYK